MPYSYSPLVESLITVLRPSRWQFNSNGLHVVFCSHICPDGWFNHTIWSSTNFTSFCLQNPVTCILLHGCRLPKCCTCATHSSSATLNVYLQSDGMIHDCLDSWCQDVFLLDIWQNHDLAFNLSLYLYNSILVDWIPGLMTLKFVLHWYAWEAYLLFPNRRGASRYTVCLPVHFLSDPHTIIIVVVVVVVVVLVVMIVSIISVIDIIIVTVLWLSL